MNRKICLFFLIICISFGTLHASYEELECDSDPVFNTYSCSQCFDGGTKAQGDFIGFLKDDWMNGGDTSRILYKEEQEMPSMVSLDSENVVWSQIPSADGFWEYSDDFNALYDQDQGGYLLEAGQRVTWLESQTGYAYKLDQNRVSEDSNIGLLVYPIATHAILDDGTPEMDSEEHKECVLFKSAGVATNTSIPEDNAPTRLPNTGPMHYILVGILSILLVFGLLSIKNKAS